VKNIEVLSLDTVINQVDSKSGHPTWDAQTTPAVFAIRVTRTDDVSNEFDFKTEDDAMQVSRAVAHAASLCGSTAYRGS
jgi:hypothetical protein